MLLDHAAGYGINGNAEEIRKFLSKPNDREQSHPLGAREEQIDVAVFFSFASHDGAEESDVGHSVAAQHRIQFATVLLDEAEQLRRTSGWRQRRHAFRIGRGSGSSTMDDEGIPVCARPPPTGGW